MMRIVVLASGKGSNLSALISEAKRTPDDFQIVAVLSDKAKCYAVQIAKDEGIPVRLILKKDHERRDSWNKALADAVAAYDAQLVVLAGFMRILDNQFLCRHGNYTINIHPSLLPCFPGLHAQQQAIDAGVRISGATVHLVDQGVDTGPILAQAAVPVMLEDSAQTLHERIQKTEHPLLCSVVRRIASGEITLNPVTLSVKKTTTESTFLFSPPLQE